MNKICTNIVVGDYILCSIESDKSPFHLFELQNTVNKTSIDISLSSDKTLKVHIPAYCAILSLDTIQYQDGLYKYSYKIKPIFSMLNGAIIFKTCEWNGIL